MIETVKVPTPVRYVTQTPDGSQRRYGMHTMTMRRVSIDEAPVAVRFVAHNQMREPAGTVAFRAFEGKLWTRMREAAYHVPVRETDVVPHGLNENPLQAWERRREEFWPGVHDHPFLPGRLARQGDGDMRRLNEIEFDEHPDNDHFRRVSTAMERRMGQAILMDHYVWVPTTGPLLVARPMPNNKKSGILFRTHHPEERSYRSDISSRFRVFSAFDAERTMELHRLEYEDFVDYGDPLPEIVSHEGWSLTDTIDRIQDQTVDDCAWHILWELRTFGPTDTPRRVLKASIDLRDAMTAAYGRALDFYPRNHGQAGRKEEGESVPSALLIKEPLDTLIDAVDGLLDRHAVKAWRVVNHGLRDRAASMEDATQLANFSI